MALDSLTARANTGAGTDALAGKQTASGFAGAAILVGNTGAEISSTNKLPVDASGSSVNTFNAKFRDAFQAYPGSNWSTAAQASGDLVMIDGNAGGASYLTVSLDPLTAGTETQIESIGRYTMALDAAAGIHLSQRTLGQEFSFEIVSDETPTTTADIAISSIQQATTTLTVTTATAHGLRVGARIGIRGITADSRFNYPSLVIATTPTETTFTATAGPGGTIASVTAGPYASQGYVYMRSAMGGAPNGSSMLFENATATNASFYVKSEGGDATPIGGTLAGNHSATISTTASAQPINAALNYAFRPSSEYRIALMADRVQWADVAVDSTGQTSNRANFTQIAPNPDKNYKIRIRAVNTKALTVPVAHILSVSKTGTTTATVVTQTPHGLTTGNVIAAYGVRDQTNFANLTTATAVASVVNATTFTVVWGAAVTASSQAGVIYRVNGGVLPSSLGAIAQVVQSVARTSNVLTLVGSAAWSGLLIGDYVNIAALHDTGGTDLALDGTYRVRDIQTTSLFLEPIGSAPTGGNIVTTNCGGVVIKRTDIRISFVRLFDFERVRIEALARPNSDASGAVPVVLQGQGITASQNVAQISGATPNTSVSAGSTNRSLGVSIGTAVAQTDVSAAAFAGAGRVNGTVIASAQGGGAVVTAEINVSALTLGTATAVYAILQESSGGTNFTDIWISDPITTTGIRTMPAIPVQGRRRWSFFSVGGTSTTVTVTITTNELPAGSYPVMRQFRDAFAATNPFATFINNAASTASNFALITAGSSSSIANVEGCKQVTAFIILAGGPTVTTQPVIKLQGSMNATNWVDIPSATMTAAGNGMYAVSVNNTAFKYMKQTVGTAAVYSAGSYTISNMGFNGVN